MSQLIPFFITLRGEKLTGKAVEPMATQVDSLEVRIQADASKAAETIARLTKNVQQLSGALKNTAGATQPLDAVKKRWEYLIGVVEHYERKLADARRQFDNLGKGASKTMQGKSLQSEMTALQMLIDKYSAKLDEIEKKHPELLPKIDTTNIEKAAEATKELAEAKAAVSSGVAKWEVISSSTDVDNATSAWERFRSVMSSTASVLKTVKTAIVTVVSHLWKLISALNSTHKANGKTGLSFKKLAKFLIRYGLGMRSFFFLFRRLRRGMKEGFEHLGQYSEEAQMAIYGLKASVETLKNAFAAGFSNLLGPVVNFLQGFINAISSALNALGRLIAALGGKGFAIQAIKISADSMKDLDNNTGSAASSAKKLEKALSVLPFDELNQLNGDKNSGGSGGGGGGGGANALSASQMFETIALDESDPLVSWGKRVREAFTSSNWTELGALLAEPINTGVSKIHDIVDWEKNKPKIEAFTKGVTTTFNSLVKNVDWVNIGKTISDTIDDITLAVNGLVDGTNWRGLGDSIGTAFNTILEDTDWVALGKTLFSRFKIILETALGFIETTNWTAAGTAMGNFVLGALENINLPKVGEALAKMLNGAMDAALAFINTGALGQGVSDFGDMIVKFAETTEWEKVGEVIGRGLASVDWGKFLGDMVTAFWTAFTGLLKGLLGSGGGGIAMLLGGAWLGSKIFKGLFGAGALGGGGSLLGGIGELIGAHPIVSMGLGLLLGTGAIGKAANAERRNAYANMSPEEFYKATGLTDKDLKKAGYTRQQAYDKTFTYMKKNIKQLQSMRQKWEDSPFGTLFKNMESAAIAIGKSDAMPRNTQVVLQETQKVAWSAGQKTTSFFVKGINETRSAAATSLQPTLTALAGSFSIGDKVKPYGKTAVEKFYQGANENKQTVANNLAGVANTLAGKFNIDAKIKGYGKSGAQAFVSGANSLTSTDMSFSTLFSNIKTALLSTDAKNTLTNAGKTMGAWIAGGIASQKMELTVPKVDYSTERAKQFRLGITVLPNARGGIYDSATIIGYGVGEAGKEAILPLENQRTMGMIANSILGGYGANSMADQIVRGVTEAMMNASRNQQINVNATLYTEDNEVLARAVNKGNRAINYRESAYAYTGA